LVIVISLRHTCRVLWKIPTQFLPSPSKKFLQDIHVKELNIPRLLYQVLLICLQISLCELNVKKSISWKSRCLRFQNTCISSGRYVSLFLRMQRFQRQGLRKGSSLLKNVSSLQNIKNFHFSLKYLSCKISPTQ